MNRSRPLCRPGAIVALGIFIAGCSSGPPKPAPPPPRVESANGAVVAVSASQSGAQVVLQRSQVLQVELVNDAGSVTNGYEWQLVDSDPAVLAPEPPRFERATRDINAFESAGTTIWRFRPAAPGQVAMQFALRLPRRLDPPLATVRFDVTVK